MYIIKRFFSVFFFQSEKKIMFLRIFFNFNVLMFVFFSECETADKKKI